jgi:glycosyltransferase involved in cell wall biosynthesis
MKITFACIVFNGNYVLKQLIESIYPYAHKIVFVDGVVKFWADRGYDGSNDGTADVIANFPDPENKIVLHRNIVAAEKTELCNIFMESVPSDTDYLWCIDSDEIFKPEDIEKTIEILKARSPHYVSFKSNTFFGGFDHVLGGFEAEHNFKRLLKFESGCKYVQHRPPTLSTENVPNPLHITGVEMSQQYGVEMYHYSYTFAKQVYEKIQYYKGSVSKENCIDNYFDEIWLKWVLNPELRAEIEDKYNGVHEFIPSYRGECRTIPFTGTHPQVIAKDMESLIEKFKTQLATFNCPQ